MDAPNAPNPANPNVQDQFLDAVQGPTNQAQGPAAQNQAQGPAVQNQAQGPANNNGQIGQNVQCAASTTTSPNTTSPHWSRGACPSSVLSKLDRKET